MFFCIAIAVVFFFASFGVTAPVARDDSYCNSGSVQCCNSIEQASTEILTLVLSTTGMTSDQISGQVGVTCSPVTDMGESGNSCSAQTVCCENNNFNGLIALGCTPINISL
ncbi:hypothetical protein AMATHDRAFT_150975 [Amanita thiersii Skay4041]|uniref:Hydrophobin n=1 Tax=Amanita thiersii Skay4041 TaxID=703135 RepID=A0A2A9NJM9_9AGAR|nr:hypothetical protein AMATHDRAFT_150975 [Amanita thiersii Skay4041]